MKAAFQIKKYLNRWITIVIRSGMKITIKVREISNNLFGNTFIKYEVAGSRELKQIAKSEIVDIYA